jgi:hypothetical protein
MFALLPWDACATGGFHRFVGVKTHFPRFRPLLFDHPRLEVTPGRSMPCITIWYARHCGT